MIISLNDDLLAVSHHANFINAATKLCESHIYGRHLVIIEYKLARYIIESNLYSQLCKTVAKWNLINLSTISPYLDEVTIYAQIKNTTGRAIRTQNHFQEIIQIPYRQINTRMLHTKTELIGEYLYDCDIFEHIAREHITINNLYLSKIAVNKINGGGSTTSTVYDRRQKSADTFLLAIADSDMTYPNDANKGTATQLESSNNIKYALSETSVIPIREIENLVRADEIPYACRKQARYTSLLAVAQKIEVIQRSNSSLSIYHDIKGGLSYRQVKNSQASDPNYYKFIHAELVNLGFVGHAENYGCKNPPNCSKKKQCECWIIEPTKTIMSNIVKERNKSRLKIRINSKLDHISYHIGLTVYSWCVAWNKMSTQ